MPERPGENPPPRPQTDHERAEAARHREVARKAPPLPHPPPPFPAEPPIAAGLAELAPWWLEARCGCGHVSFIPLRLLAAQRGWRTSLGSVLPRLRCRQCRAAPERVDLISSPAYGAVGTPGGAGKRLRLVGE